MISKEDQEKAAFYSNERLFEFFRMHSGVQTHLHHFEGLSTWFSLSMWKTCLVCLDNIIIFSTNSEEHIDHVDSVLTELGKAKGCAALWVLITQQDQHDALTTPDFTSPHVFVFFARQVKTEIYLKATSSVMVVAQARF